MLYTILLYYILYFTMLYIFIHTGRIQAIQLEYSESYQRLILSLRKIHITKFTNIFNLIITKLIIIVQLLMGEIPEKRVFGQENVENREILYPYLLITQAVKNGDLTLFHNIIQKYTNIFKLDKNLTLINRLSHNVLKTGLRKLSLSYSKISLADVAGKTYI